MDHHHHRPPALPAARRLVPYVGTAVVVALAVHLIYPALAGIEKSIHLLGRADLWWIAVGLVLSALSMTCYVAVFRYVVGAGPEGERLDWRASYEVSMASQAASTVITAAGAGGVALLYWALGHAGLDRRESATRIVAFLAYHYVIYLGAVLVFGALLWTGVLPGRAPTGLTLVPAVVAVVLFAVAALMAWDPERFERAIADLSRRESRRARLARRLVTAPAALAAGIRYAIALLRPRSRGLALLALALGYWAANIGVLASCFEAFGHGPALATLVEAYFVGMAANLLPLLPGGVGSVEASMIATLLAFGQPGAEVVVSVLSYRLIAFWLPTLPEAVAYFQLRRTVARWEEADLVPASPGVT